MLMILWLVLFQSFLNTLIISSLQGSSLIGRALRSKRLKKGKGSSKPKPDPAASRYSVPGKSSRADHLIQTLTKVHNPL